MIRGIRSVAIGVANLATARRFYEEAWHLSPVEAGDGWAVLRGTSRYHHILELHAVGAPCLVRIVFDVADRAAVMALHARVAAAAGVQAVEAPGELALPGGGWGFGCRDPEGRNLAFACEVDDAMEAPAAADRVRKVAHVNVNVGDLAATLRFFVEVLGFSIIDESIYYFLHCDSTDHSSMVISKSGGATLNHIAFELPDLESVMRGAGRMKDAGYPIEWGVGRHGAANNVFAYFAGPDEFPIEYTAEVLQVDASYEPHGPDYWKFPPGRSDQWGVTAPRSARLARLQTLFLFDEDGWRVTGA
jgi:catechol 2,3-dioxygenase